MSLSNLSRFSVWRIVKHLENEDPIVKDRTINVEEDPVSEEEQSLFDAKTNINEQQRTENLRGKNSSPASNLAVSNGKWFLLAASDSSLLHTRSSPPI
jgi:hypothetical protein